MEPLVSVIVPIYQVEAYLPQCVQSLRQQTYSNLEILLVEDGSPDNCAALCDQFARLDSRIRVIHQENRGLSASRNRGVREAKGEWILFVDGDDWIEPETCAVLVEASRKYGNDELILHGVCKDYGGLTELFHGFAEGQVLSGEELLEGVLDLDAWIACAYAKLICRELLVEKNIFHDEQLRQGVEALEFNVRLFQRVESAVYVRKWLYHYRYNDQSISVKLTEETNRLIVLGYEKIAQQLMAHPNWENLQLGLYERIQHSVISGAIRCYFHAQVPMTCRERREKFAAFLENDLICRAVAHRSGAHLPLSRRFALFCIRYRLWFVLPMLSKLRFRQLRGRGGNGT